MWGLAVLLQPYLPRKPQQRVVWVKEKRQVFQVPATVWTLAAHPFSSQAEGDG